MLRLACKGVPTRAAAALWAAQDAVVGWPAQACDSFGLWQSCCLAAVRRRPMEFRLIYEGPLQGQGAKASHKWEIRRALHPQLQRLWQLPPLAGASAALLAHPAAAGRVSVIVEKGGLRFAPLVTRRLNLYAEVSVLLFRQQPRGTLITDGGDIDNRLKTLLDGLRVPRGAQEGRSELPAAPDPQPFFCLLEDDSLVTKVTVESEQLLRPAPPNEVVAIVGVHVKKTVLTHENMAL